MNPQLIWTDKDGVLSAKGLGITYAVDDQSNFFINFGDDQVCDLEDGVTPSRRRTVDECKRICESHAFHIQSLLDKQAKERVALTEWVNGIPPKPWSTEWFIAKLDNGEKVVLRELPEEYSYDFKTADDTYYMSHRIAKWMQFPDSDFVAFTPPEQEAGRVKCPYCFGNGMTGSYYMSNGEPQDDVMPCENCKGTGFLDDKKIWTRVQATTVTVKTRQTGS